MKIYFFDSLEGNFGDDLNRWLWSDLLGDLDQYTDAATLVGIGTYLNNEVPDTPHKLVFGTGVGYSPLPKGLHDKSWKIFAVRGPLSAKAAGLEAEDYITDSAIMVREVIDKSVIRNGNGNIVFMPHISAAKNGSWGKICERCGIKYLDPRQDAKYLVREIMGAKLVIADAMHAAIIADTYRVPWIPVVTSNEISTMKWYDWTQSMSVSYIPYVVSHSSLKEMFKHFSRKIRGEEYCLFYDRINEEFAIQFPNNLEDMLLENYFARFGIPNAEVTNNHEKSSSSPGQKIRTFLLKYKTFLLTVGESRIVSFLTKPVNYCLEKRAEKRLRRIILQTPTLSSDDVFAQKSAKYGEALNELKNYLDKIQATS